MATAISVVVAVWNSRAQEWRGKLGGSLATASGRAREREREGCPAQPVLLGSGGGAQVQKELVCAWCVQGKLRPSCLPWCCSPRWAGGCAISVLLGAGWAQGCVERGAWRQQHRVLVGGRGGGEAVWPLTKPGPCSTWPGAAWRESGVQLLPL